jgi:hypothetical protein
MITINDISSCINNSEKLISKLPVSVSERPGMSSRKIRHLLNNLCALPDARYLNIGLCSGSSFWSAIYHNNVKATGIDWFRNDTTKGTEKEFWANFATVISLEEQTLDRYIQIYNQDCFTVKPKDKFNIYLYDAGHSEENQYKALTYFNEYLDDEFVLLVDDWDDKDVQLGTTRAIKDLGYKVKFFWEGAGRFGNWEPSSDTWWNGFLVALIKKNE